MAKQILTDGQRALKNHDAAGALKCAEQAEALNPGFYQNAWLRGKALLALGKSGEAATAFESALAGQPAFLTERQQLKELLQTARSAK